MGFRQREWHVQSHYSRREHGITQEPKEGQSTREQRAQDKIKLEKRNRHTKYFSLCS